MAFFFINTSLNRKEYTQHFLIQMKLIKGTKCKTSLKYQQKSPFPGTRWSILQHGKWCCNWSICNMDGWMDGWIVFHFFYSVLLLHSIWLKFFKVYIFSSLLACTFKQKTEKKKNARIIKITITTMPMLVTYTGSWGGVAVMWRHVHIPFYWLVTPCVCCCCC